MPNVQYYNRTGPFWDFVANLEEQGASHPFFNGNNNANAAGASDNENEHPAPWTGGWGGFQGMPWGPFAYRGPRPSGPPGHGPAEGENNEAGPSEPRGPPPGFSDSEEGPHVPRPGRRDHHHHGHGHGHGRHGMGPRSGHCGRGRGRGWGRHGRDFPDAAKVFGAMGPLAELFQSQLFGESGERGEDFKPDADVFDTTEGFVVHISLPGAKKEDVGVNWDAEKSELTIAGVIYRPGDEEFLKTIAVSERKVGAFERKVRLGSRANPAQVDVDGIMARMEDGVLRIEVPKLDTGYVEIKKVDIE